MKTIIVTGAKGGIGSAVVSRLKKQQIPVLAVDKEDFDLSDAKKVEKFCKSLVKKEIGGLVNNGGIYLGKDLFDYSFEEMQRVLAVNLFGAVQLSQAVGQKLVKAKQKGAIVNISSISAFEGSSDALYGTSKAALLGLTKSCALTFAPYVRVNAVAPGIVDTPLIKAIPKWRLKEFETGERLKERISPEAVASAVWFLLSDESRHTTGSVLDLNNGGYFR